MKKLFCLITTMSVVVGAQELCARGILVSEELVPKWGRVQHKK